MRTALLALVLLTGATAAAPVPEPVADEDQACTDAVAHARAQAATLPPGDPSRRFAESDLQTALTEMASGEVEDCSELVERALRTVEERPYRLRPGEVLHGYGPPS